MKKVLLISFLCWSFISTSAINEVTVSGSNGANGTYNTLTAAGGAFEAINLVGQGFQNITIEISASTTGETGAVALTGAAGMWTTLKIYPTGSGVVITASVAAALIHLNGADNVTIDGDVGGDSSTKDMVISNTNVGAGTTSTIQFSGDANGNTIKNCIIKGSSTSTSAGIIYFANGSSSGNDNNLIDNNDITCSADANRPIKAIYSEGATVANNNSDNTVSNNNIFDFLNRANNSNGIQLAGFNTSWSINNNSFYEQATLVPTLNVNYSVIYISGITTEKTTISGNYIGGSAPLCGGVTAFTKTAVKNNAFVGININAAAGANKETSVQGNTIKYIDWENFGAATWMGIYISAGDVLIGTVTGNVIGDTVGTTSIKFKPGTPTNFYGINTVSSGVFDCQNNTISSIYLDNGSPANFTQFWGIRKQTASVASNIIKNNQIGSSVANSISSNSISSNADQRMYAIYTSFAGSILIENNTINNITNGTTRSGEINVGFINGITCFNSTSEIFNNTISNLTIANADTTSLSNASAIGISTAGGLIKKIAGNTIFNLTNIFPSFKGHIFGIFCEGTTSGNLVYNNIIHSLGATGTTPSDTITGIRISRGAGTYYNNIITLGNNNPTTTFYGIFETRDNSNDNSIYFNTISITGSPNGVGDAKSAALYCKGLPNTTDIRNNIFFNARTNTGVASGKHFAAYLAYSGNATLTMDFNDYIASGTGGMLGYHTAGVYNSANDISTLGAWQTATGQDSYSLNTDPAFTVAAGTSTTATDYQPGIDLPGKKGTGITSDYGNTTRTTNNPTSMGAWERAITNKWIGTTTAWLLRSNWSCNLVPEETTDLITFATAPDPANNLIMDTDHTVAGITNTSGKDFDVNAKTLYNNAGFTFGGTGRILASANGSRISMNGTTAQNIPASIFKDDKVFDLNINNANNPTLSGNLILLNELTATSGRLDAVTNSSTFTYGGSTAQSIVSGEFLSDRAYNLTIDNAAGVTVNPSNSFTAENVLTINANRTLTIPVNKLLTVNGSINNLNGADGILIKSRISDASTDANGSLIFAGTAPQASVEFFCLASWVGGPYPAPITQYNWQYFGIPITSLVANDLFYGDYVRKHNEAGWGTGLTDTGWTKRWLQLSTYSALTPFTGYEIVHATPMRYTYRGQLINSNFSVTLSHTTNNPGIAGEYPGQHIISNPYTAAINIANMTFGSEVEHTIYLYNTGTFTEWQTAKNGIPLGASPGQYVAIPANLIGIEPPLFTPQVPSMQGFLVKTSSPVGDHTFGFNYSAVTSRNVEAQRAPSSRKSNTDAIETYTVIDLTGKQFSDKMWLVTVPGKNRTFDNGWDGRKMTGSSRTPKLFAKEPDGDYQISTVSDINNTDIAFKATETTDYTLTFTHYNLTSSYDELYLYDLVTNTVTDISADSTRYTFAASPMTNAETRFRIITEKEETTEISNASKSGLTAFCSKSTLFIKNKMGEKGECKLFNMNGVCVMQKTFSAMSVTAIPTDFAAGNYVLTANNGSETITKKIVL